MIARSEMGANVCMGVYGCVQVCIGTCMCVYRCVQVCTCVYRCVQVCIGVYMCICVYRCVYVYSCVQVCIGVCIGVYMCMYVCIGQIRTIGITTQPTALKSNAEALFKHYSLRLKLVLLSIILKSLLLFKLGKFREIIKQMVQRE